MIVKQSYAGVSGAASVSTSSHQRTRTARCQKGRKSLIKVGVRVYYLKFVKLIKKVYFSLLYLVICLFVYFETISIWMSGARDKRQKSKGDKTVPHRLSLILKLHTHIYQKRFTFCSFFGKGGGGLTTCGECK